MADTQKKTDRLLQMIEDGHADPAVAGTRLNELSAQKRETTAALAVRLDDSPTIPPTNGAESLRKLLQDLRLGSAEADEREARLWYAQSCGE